MIKNVAVTAIKMLAVNYFIVFYILCWNGILATDHESSQSAQEYKYTISDCNHQYSNEPYYIKCENKTIENIASEVRHEMYKKVLITLNTTHVHMNESVSFVNLTSLTIDGIFHPTTVTTIACNTGTGAGIIMENIRSVILTNLNFSYCGASFTNVFKKNKIFSSTLIMSNCSDVQICQLAIEQSNGTGLMILNHRGANITLNITNSHFHHNGCGKNYSCSEESNYEHTYAHFGGGVYLAIAFTSNYNLSSILSRSGIENCHYHFSNVNFIENCAKYGGGVYYFSDRSEQTPINTTVLFDDCHFERNRAHVGSAVYLTPDIRFKQMTGHSIAPTFKNCTFLENFVFAFKESSGQKTFGLGTICTSLQDIKFEGHNDFQNNWGTALYIVNAIVNFQKSSATFVSNTGLQGGAITLIGPATVILGPNRYEFRENKAFHQGGAIYVQLIDKFDIEVSQSCFIQYVDPDCNYDIDDDDDKCDEWPWRVNITFDGNKVIQGKTGHTIYATSLYSCQFVSKNNSDHTVNIMELFTQLGVENGTDQIATDGSKIHINNSNTPLKIIPGEECSHKITVTDDLDHEASLLFRVIMSNLTEPRTDEFEIGHTFIEKTLQLVGKPMANNQSKRIKLYTLSPRQKFIEIEVELIDCPPGFKLNNTKCICNENAAVGIYQCDLEKYQRHLLPGYWAGFLSNDSSDLVTCTCPFCDYTESLKVSTSEFYINLPTNKSELERAVCGDTRQGTVCGVCRKNYTVHFHSPGYLCKPTTIGDSVSECKLGWLFYILSELVPVTLVFIVILIFNISFTSGKVSGLILFSQLLGMFDIDASGIIKLSTKDKHNIDRWAEGYKIIYGVFNLDFFNSENVSFCIMPNASALDVIAFKYVTILYALILIASVIWIMNKCGGRCCGKYCRITTVKSSVIHGISSFLVICYTQCVRISMNLLNPVHFNVEVGHYTPPPRVWYNAEIEYFRYKHLKYALPALFCLLTIGIFPPALLLSYPLLNRVTAFFGCDDIRLMGFFSRKLSISYLKPLLDSFQSCFKDNMRFFAGLYFLYRMVILFIYAITVSYNDYYTAVSGALLVMLVLHTICQPYVNRVHNIIDALLFANLILISEFSFYSYHSVHYLRGVEHLKMTFVAVLQLILIYLPLIMLGVYALVVLCKRIAKSKPIVSTERAIKLREFIHTISNENEGSDSDEVELTHDQLMDEDVEYNTNTCGYIKAGDDMDSQMTLNYM